MRKQILLSLLLTLPVGLMPLATPAQEVDVGMAVDSAPPPIPVYDQPPPPAEGYLWTPGYWAYGPQGYYWVPGTWVLPPAVGLLWTPGYWGWNLGRFFWNLGYWGPRIGFYGGINYGCGYFGVGFEGGFWRGRDFVYNRAVTNVTNIHSTNVYDHAPYGRDRGDRTGFNGGRDGTHAQPSAPELAMARGPHRGPTAEQGRHATAARTVPGLLAANNHGAPPIAATPHAAAFHAGAATPARGSAVPSSRPSDRPAWAARSTAPQGAGRTVPSSAVTRDTRQAPGMAAAAPAYRAAANPNPGSYASSGYRPPAASNYRANASRPSARSYSATGYGSPRYGEGYRANAARPNPSYASRPYAPAPQRAQTYSRPPAQRFAAATPPSRSYASPAQHYSRPAPVQSRAPSHAASSHGSNSRRT